VIAWFARNHVAANLLMALLLVGGLTALPRIQQKAFPDIDIEIIQTAVTYLGAAPEEVEEGVCIRIEEAIQGIAGIEKITSSAAEGACGVSAELLQGYPVDRALSEIKNAVDSITTFPADTEKPIVSHPTIKRNTLQIAVAADAEERPLKVYGERIRDGIAALPGITQVELYNARDDEVSVEVPEYALRRYGLTFDEVVNAVRRGSLDRPGGSIKTEGGEVLLRTKGQAYTAADFEQIVVLTREDGTRLLLSDVGRVVDGFDEDDRFATFDGKPAVTVKVFRVGDQKVLRVADTAKRYLAGLQGTLPDGLDVTVWTDSSQTLRDRLDILVRNGLSGFVLVFVVLALFLRLRLALWVSIGVPLSILGALWLFPALDISIDVISLFAFIMVLGLLVDDAIVVGENVHRHQENAEDPLESAIVGTQEVSVPVIFGVLTTVVAFLPMILAPGQMGQIFGVIGMTSILCLLISVVESQLVLPAHLGHMKLEDGTGSVRAGSLSDRWRRFQRGVSTSLQRLARDRYRPLLERALEWRYVVIASGVSLLLIAVASVAFGIGSARLNFAFFPPIESDYITASLTMPQGTPVARTAEAARVLEHSAERLKRELDTEGQQVAGESLVKHIMVSVGEQPFSSRANHGGESAAAGGSHLAEVTIEVQSGDSRPISSKVMSQRWRELTPPIADVVELTYLSAFFSVGDPIDIQLQAADVGLLRRASEQLKKKLADYAGVSDINDSFRDGKREVKLSILPAAQTLGLTLDDLARQVRQAFYGAEAQRIQRGRDDVRVMVRYPQDERRSLADLDELRIRTRDGGEVPFYAVARAEFGRGYATIKRADRQRVIDVTADVDDTQVSANEVISDLRKGFLPALMRDHPGLSYSLEGEQAEQAESLGALFGNYLFALIAIYALLAIPLRSYVQPLIIMAVIPFGLVGAIFGHWLMYTLREVFTEQSFNVSMMSIFRVVALTGVVVNSSLVLVHYVNEQRLRGVPLERAVRDAGVARFRPIVLTSMTTFAGLTPMLTEGSVSAQFLIPMATSLGFGVLFGSVISLFLVPSGYLVLEDLRTLAGGKRGDVETGDPPGAFEGAR